MRRNVLIGAMAFAATFASWNSTALEVSANNDIKNYNSGLEHRLESSVAALVATQNQLRDLLDGILARLDGIDTRLNGMEARIAALEAKDTGIPQNTVAAFHRTACPTGWKRYTAADGRFLVGYGTAGSRSYTTIGSNVDSANWAGAAMVNLQRAHLPNFTLPLYFSEMVGGDDAAFMSGWASGRVLMAERQLRSSSANGGLGATAVGGKTAALGSGTAFDNRPPFAVVLWCYKE